MNYSKKLENMFAMYNIGIIQQFCDCSNIYLFIGTNFPHSRNVVVSVPVDGIHDDHHWYDFKDSKTFYFHLPEGKLYGGWAYSLVLFKYSEEEIINKFHKFMKMKAFI